MKEAIVKMKAYKNYKWPRRIVFIILMEGDLFKYDTEAINQKTDKPYNIHKNFKTPFVTKTTISNGTIKMTN